ncbi:hypothetical protein SAMN05216598_4355 [Pseudomonas asplenii]|uniref:Uncharacterized protein n=1 Tax=Pseudomonas asplenii TaxID=53407 RepID=A0A1H1YCX9_9PSED|nr:hypothetical protein [Pseudomonas asplenii]SDT19303.1 hypothetical protein SAMN05216598_4355 [Pseudomonas asplenii]
MASNIQFEGDFTPSIKTWIEEEFERAFALCIKQFSGCAIEWQIPKTVVKEGYGGEARLDQLELCLSPTLDLNAQDEEKSYQVKAAKRLIHHELVHIFQHQVLRKNHIYALPTWFSEGMAVAFSGQTLSWDAGQLQKDLDAMGQIPRAEQYLIMTGYKPFDMNRPPFNALYEIWGGLFAYSVAQAPKLHPDYQRNNGPHLVGDEYRRAVAIVRDTPEHGFDKALTLHTLQPILTQANLRKELVSFITA